MAEPDALLVMGVSGAGKSTVGAVLASEVAVLSLPGVHPAVLCLIASLSSGLARSVHTLLLTWNHWSNSVFSLLGWKFYDADDYHPEENRAKMGKGIPLSDQDRRPWLCNLHDILLRDTASGQRVVLACSALKKVYRDILIRGEDSVPPNCGESKEERSAKVRLLVVHLSGSFEVISERLCERQGHFMPPELLQSQFDTLEPPAAPENFIQISVDKRLSEVITTVMETLRTK